MRWAIRIITIETSHSSKTDSFNFMDAHTFPFAESTQCNKFELKIKILPVNNRPHWIISSLFVFGERFIGIINAFPRQTFNFKPASTFWRRACWGLLVIFKEWRLVEPRTFIGIGQSFLPFIIENLLLLFLRTGFLLYFQPGTFFFLFLIHTGKVRTNTSENLVWINHKLQA